MPKTKLITPRTTPASTAPPRYAIKHLDHAHALYRNGRLYGLDVVLLSATHDRIAIEYTLAQRPREARVYHEIPAALIDI